MEDLRKQKNCHSFQEFSVQLTYREQWNDERLMFADLEGKAIFDIPLTWLQDKIFPVIGRLKYLTLTDPEKVWKPDTFFRNEKTAHFHSILVNNVYVRIFPNGDVLFSIRSAQS